MRIKIFLYYEIITYFEFLAGVAQWESGRFVSDRLWVQVPSPAQTTDICGFLNGFIRITAQLRIYTDFKRIHSDKTLDIRI